MDTKHTPTPWHVVGHDDPTRLDIDDQLGIENGRRYYLANVRHSNPDELRANAAFIVRAVNSHDQLVAALQACLGTLEHVNVKEGYCCCGDDMETHGNPMDCGHSPVDAGTYSAGLVMEVARAALTAAEA